MSFGNLLLIDWALINRLGAYFVCSTLYLQHFWMDGFNGSYFADFYVAMATRLKQKWPEVFLGGPVS